MWDDGNLHGPTCHEGNDQFPALKRLISNVQPSRTGVTVAMTGVLPTPAPVPPPVTRIPNVLIVDDNPGDVELLRIAFEMCDCPAQIETAGDGHAALQRLTAGATSGMLPDLVLLDLNMPRVNGIEVLSSLRRDRRLEHVPVVVLSTSGQVTDRQRCLELGAREFHTKPEHIRELVRLVQTLQHYLDSATGFTR